MNLVQQSYKILTPINDNILKHIELCGRTCYQSQDKITEDSAKEFCRKIIKMGHESVLEHQSITFKIITNRGVTHELVRHRTGIAFSQESTRYCNYLKKGPTYIVPQWVQRVYDISSMNELAGIVNDIVLQDINKINDFDKSIVKWYNSIVENAEYYLQLLDYGRSPQDARGVLCNDLKTEIVMTCNIRELRHILKLRTSTAAHPDIRYIMTKILEEMKALLPDLFFDLEIN